MPTVIVHENELLYKWYEGHTNISPLDEISAPHLSPPKASLGSFPFQLVKSNTVLSVHLLNETITKLFGIFPTKIILIFSFILFWWQGEMAVLLEEDNADRYNKNWLVSV